MEPIERHQRSHENGNRQDHVQKLRQGQEGDLGKDHRALTLLDHDVQGAKALAEQGHRDKRKGCQKGRAEQLLEEITLDQAHRLGTVLKQPEGLTIPQPLQRRTVSLCSTRPKGLVPTAERA